MTIYENRTYWDKYAWPRDGDEWSAAWGGPWAQWHWCIRPRIAGWLPTGRILEIAFGHGRWTKFLAKECERITAVEVSPECVEWGRSHPIQGVDFCLCDGKSLSGISDNSVDFAFSFDSLVHADADVIASYLKELGRVLKPGAAAFIHHSNFGQYPDSPAQGGRVRDMTAPLFGKFAADAGVPCLVQECITWSEGPELRDCLSTVQKGPAPPHGDLILFNEEFMIHAEHVKAFGEHYAQPQS